jgi:hypothetical protein
MQGETKNNVYVYQESVLKYIVTSNAQNNVTIKKRTLEGDINHGDHIDYGIIRKRDGSIIVKVHYTVYHDYSGDFNFSRSCEDCNFTLKDTMVNLTNLNQIQCEDKNGPTQFKMIQKYPRFSERDIIHRLTLILLGKSSGGGSRKQLYKFDKLQKGGMGYKSITFFTDKFISFLSKSLFVPIFNIRPDLCTIQILFDELDDVCIGGSTSIIILYDFRDHVRNIFSIDSKMMIVACYADDQINHGNAAVLTSYENGCFQEVNKLCRSLAINVEIQV